jgi:glycerophosphoryl diester phosphodiesterase
VAQRYGQNELTGKKVSYISPKDVAGISGSVEFAERVNQTTLVTIKLVGTTAGGSQHTFHENNVATSGNIIAGLNPVNGDTGISKTQVATLVGGAAVTYTQFLTQNAYVNVHLSTEQWLPWWHKVTSDQTYLVLNQNVCSH